MTAADYRAMLGLAPAGAVEPTQAARGRWGVPARTAVTAAPAAPSACELQQPVTGENATPKPKRKYGNEPVLFEGQWYDSGKELTALHKLRALANACAPQERVERIERQVRFELIPKQEGERPACYVADFVAHMANGTRRVIDVKSVVTRKLPAYVLKRKLMLQVHGIRIEEW